MTDLLALEPPRRGAPPVYRYKKILPMRKIARINAMTDLIADGTTLKEAARLLGVSETTATKDWRAVKRNLGWQAS